MRLLRKELLLLGRDEIECGRWKFVLETRGNFRVITSSCVIETLELVATTPGLRAIVTDIPGALGADALAECSRLPVVLFGVSQPLAETLAAYVVSGHEAVALRLIDAVKTACARKRGPHGEVKQPALTPLQMYRQLSIERDGVPA